MIGLFGGSFDPIHHGHLIVAQTVIEALGLEELRFMPAQEQPFKVGLHRAPAALRAEMVARAIAGQPGFALERAELERPGPSYTVETLRELRRREPGRQFVVLLGSDAALDLGGWKEAAAIPALARLVVFRRAGSAPPASSLVSETVDVPAIEISATEIRARVARGQSIRYWVPDAVAELIAANGLYRHGEA
jgi:nicotinate-nucleotide adenylyltransferase